MVGFELLPGPLREQVLNFQMRVSSEQLPVSVDYLLASGHEALLGTMSWMEVTRLQQSDIISPAAASLQVSMRHTVQCFCGAAGSGKSHSMAASTQAQAIRPVAISISETATAADIIACLAQEESGTPYVQLSVSSYARCAWLNQLLYQLLVEGAVTDPATGSVFAFLPNAAAAFQIEIPNAVPGEVQQETPPPFAHLYPQLSGPQYGMLLHLPVLADLVGSSHEPRTKVLVVDPDAE